jgi:hypothetical protein
MAVDYRFLKVFSGHPGQVGKVEKKGLGRKECEGGEAFI